MRTKIIIFGAVYMVVLEGVLLLMLTLKQSTLDEKLVVFISGTTVLCIALLFVKILKRLIAKNRTHKQFDFFTPQDGYAFPSGHATGLAALTLFIFERNTVLGSMSILLSIVVIVTRIKANTHDYIDIAGGIVLGVAVTYFLSPIIESLVRGYISTHMFL